MAHPQVINVFGPLRRKNVLASLGAFDHRARADGSLSFQAMEFHGFGLALTLPIEAQWLPNVSRL